MAHLLCGLFIRLRALGLTEGLSFDLPVTQADLADTVGLTSVRVNRTLKELRAQGLSLLQGRKLTIVDLDRLAGLAMFNTNHLHLEHEGANRQDGSPERGARRLDV